jgi:hypothetical protein
MDNTILRHEENGVEFFTVLVTGESGLSTSGIAISLGVSQQAITKSAILISTSVTTSDLPNSLQPLWGKPLQLQLKYKNIKIFGSDAWACFAEYYAFEAKRKTQEALAVYRSFARIGAESYIQARTGWLPVQYQSAQESRQTIDRLLGEPRAYLPVFTKVLCDKGFSWYGCNFFWEYFYFWMTPEEQAYLNRVNPVVNGKRKQKIHQWIEEGMLDRIADKGHNLILLLKISSCQAQFEENHRRMYGKGFQAELDI